MNLTGTSYVKKTRTFGPCPVCGGVGEAYSGTSGYKCRCHYCNGSKQVVTSETEETVDPREIKIT